jgi:hypothetical protein
MLSSIVSSAASTTAASSAITMSTALGIGVGGALVAVVLILLLSSKELISSTALDSPKVRKMLNFAIIPLLAVFVLNVTFMLFM